MTLEIIYNVNSSGVWGETSLPTWNSSLQNINEYVAALIALKQKMIDGE